jgi:hypothetical protein
MTQAQDIGKSKPGMTVTLAGCGRTADLACLAGVGFFGLAMTGGGGAAIKILKLLFLHHFYSVQIS